MKKKFDPNKVTLGPKAEPKQPDFQGKLEAHYECPNGHRGILFADDADSVKGSYRCDCGEMQQLAKVAWK